MIRQLVCLTVFAVALVFGGPTAYSQVISDLITDIETNIAGGDPLPDNLFDTSGPNPFSNLTINGGDDTLATVWEQTVIINRTGNVNVGGILSMPTQIDVQETDSQFQFYEFPTEQTFVTAGDPIIHSQFVMGGVLQSMTLDLVDADNNGGNGFTPFINDVPEIPLDLGTEIAVWQGQPVQVEIVALTLAGLQPIAINTMVPFQFFGDDGTDELDNAFGVFTGDWVLPLGSGVLLDEDGAGPGTTFAPSAFLEEWEDMVQFRWKGHPGGWVMVTIGSPLPGPAGVIHGGGGNGEEVIPEPSTFVLSILGLLGLGFATWRRRRRA